MYFIVFGVGDALVMGMHFITMFAYKTCIIVGNGLTLSEGLVNAM